MGIFGAVVGCIVMQGLLAQPWAKGQSGSPESAMKSLTTQPVGSATYGKMDGSGTAPRLIPFQAYLTDSNGRPVEGQHSLTFRIYAAPTQGSALWTETHPAIPVTEGMVNVLLGSITPFDSLTFDTDRYVGITVDGRPEELVPRHQIVASVYAADADRAKHAEQADEATHAVAADRSLQLAGGSSGFLANSTEVTPIGAVIPWFGDPAELPANWRICDGSVVADPQSPLDGKNVPDLRSKFVRGEQDLSRNILATETNTGGSDVMNLEHTHSLATDGTHDHSSVTGLDGWHNHGGVVNASNMWWTGVESYVRTSGNRVDLPDAALAYSVAAFGSGDDIGLWGRTHRHEGGLPAEGDHSHSISAGGLHEHGGVTGSSGNANQDNRPAFVALHYIIRIK